MKIFTKDQGLLVMLLLCCVIFGYGQSDVIISQYIETNSGSTPKGIEVFNVSGSDIVFSAGNNLQVYQGTNGASCGTLVNITSGTLLADEVWVIGTSDLVTFANNNGADLSGTTTQNFQFNGDDALQVRLGGVIQDVFGTCGSDPGSSWSGGGVSTANNNLEIIDDTCDGDTDGFVDPSTRFNEIANGSTMTGFGSIGYSCGAACTAPATQASNFAASSITTNSMDVSWDDGNGDRVLVLAKAGAAVDADPSDGTAYSADANFGDGDEIGTGNFVVYDAAGASPGSSSVSITGLNAGATYHFAIYSYNDVDDCYNTDELVGNATTAGPDIQLQYPISTDVDCGALTIDFGSVETGVGTNTLTFRIENTGDADLTLTLPLTIGGTNAGDYTITTQPSGTIAAASFSDVTVEFAPSAAGTRTASIDIVSDDGDESPCTVNLTGFGSVENDECTDAIVLTVNPNETCAVSTAGTTVGATDSGIGNLTCNGFTGNESDDVWFSFVATSTTHTVLISADPGFDAVVDIRSGACDGTNIDCADDNGAGGDEEVEVTGLTNGNTYYVRVYSFGTTSGTFDVCVTTPPPPANPGDVVINEFMAAPDCAANNVAEYVELYNTTTSPIDIEGWTLSDDDSDSHTFSSANGTTIIPAEGYLLCAIDLNVGYFGFTPAYDYSSFVLANGGDEIVLADGGTEICRVDYTNGDPFGGGVSTQLPVDYDYSLADDGEILMSEYIASNTSFGCGDFGTPNAANALPVNLLSLNAKVVENQVVLKFTTATEENNSHFLIQRSIDEGKTFATIGQLDGQGDSNEAVNYEFVDAKPANGLNYYRLQQFDFDGANEFFGPVVVRFSSEETDNPTIWPVPATDRLQVELPSVNDDWMLEVFDLNGRRLLAQKVEEKSLNVSIDLQTLPAGGYLLRWSTGTINGQQRFVKL